MAFYSTEAFILKKDICDEKDNIYHFFTRDFGKLNLLAKGTRDILAKLAGHLEMPALVNITFSLDQRSKLITALEQNPYLNIKHHSSTLSTAFKIGELVDDLTITNQKDSELFKLIFDVLYFLDNNIDKSLKIAEFSWFYFEAQFLKLLGYGPFLEGCVHCGVSETNHFSFRDRGLVCSKHYHPDDLALTSNQRKILKSLFDIPLTKINSLSLINEILKEKKFLEALLSKFTLVVKSDII